jgi:hypothetical protein
MTRFPQIQHSIGEWSLFSVGQSIAKRHWCVNIESPSISGVRQNVFSPHIISVHPEIALFRMEVFGGSPFAVGLTR